MNLPAEEFVRNLRERYPNPRASVTLARYMPSGTYCVGGALALECGHRAQVTQVTHMSTWGYDVFREVGMFPGATWLGEMLHAMNPYLSDHMALDYAKLITQKNDTGNFETAWMHLADALGYGEGDWTPADDAAVARFLTGAIS